MGRISRVCAFFASERETRGEKEEIRSGTFNSLQAHRAEDPRILGGVADIDDNDLPARFQHSDNLLQGFRAFVIAGGLRAWRDAGHPLEGVPHTDLVKLPTFS